MGTVGFREPIPPMVSPFTRGWGFVDEGIAGSAPLSSLYEAANLGIWLPIFVPTACIATRFWTANGASISGNWEVGIYYDGGCKPGAKYITSGSVAQSGADTIQFAEITDTRLDVALWWLYLSCSETATRLRVSVGAATAWDELLKFQQASVGPGSAPDPATPAGPTTANICLFGFSTNTVT